MILPTLALAAEPTGVVETVVQARPDMLGEAFVAGSAVAAGAADVRHVHLEGFGELGWPAGVPVPVVPRVFVLTADGRDDAVDWTVGRQRVDLPTWARTLDGARAAWSVRPDLRAEAWIGQARHLALEDFASGAPIARLAGTWTSPRWLAVAGLWGEGGPRGAVHPDLRLGWRDPDLRLSPDVSGLLALGFAGEGPVVERARVQATARPAAGVRAVVHGEHRGVLDPAAELGPDILAAFAPTGSDEAGVGVGWTDVRRARLWGSAAVQTWEDDAREAGLRAEVSWRPACAPQTLCVTPSWRMASGPGGLYSAAGASAALPVPDPFAATVHGWWIPYRKPHLAWDTALVLGATAEVRPSAAPWSLALGGELSRDAVAPVHPRAWLALRLGAP